MKNFMAIYTGSPANIGAWKALDAHTRAEKEKQGMAAWHQWALKNEAAIVDNGGPLGKTKRATAEGIADISNHMAAYTIVRAESQEAAARMFQDHPHFSIFPGDGVEVMEIMPIPTQ